MANLINIGAPQVANRNFVSLAAEAGLEATIKSLVTLAMDLVSLLAALKNTLEGPNPALAAALNIETLKAFLAYMALAPNAPVLLAASLPETLYEDGPASVSAARDAGTQVNVTFTEPPGGYSYEISVSGVHWKSGTLAGAGGFVNESIQGVPAGAQAIRVRFVNGTGAVTRFGPVANIS